MGILSLFTVFVCLGNAFLISCSTTKTCSRIERSLVNSKSRYYIVLFCCGNHEPIGINLCKECKAGYTSVNGEICKKCNDGKYGKRCAELCFCNKDQRCDHVLGCVPDFLKPMTTDEKPVLTTDDMLKVAESTVGNNDGSHGSFNLNIVIYILCVACTMIVMTLLIICIRNARPKESYRVHRNRAKQTTIGTTNHINGSSLEQEISKQTRHEYDEINETTMTMNFPVNSTVEKINEGNSNIDDCISNDGYLNPYQPIILYDNAHEYKKCVYMPDGRKTSKSLPGSLKYVKKLQSSCVISTEQQSEIVQVLRFDQIIGTSNLSEEATNRYGFKRKFRKSV